MPSDLRIRAFLPILFVILLSADLPADRLPGFERQGMGEWKAEAGKILQTDEIGTAVLLAGKRDAGRYSVSVRLRVSDRPGAEAGLLLHFQDSGNYLAYSLKNRPAGRYGLLRITRQKPQLTFVADQAPIPPAPEGVYELRAEVSGIDVVCYLNGKPLLAYGFQGTPPPYNSHGKTWDPDPDKGWTGLITVDTGAEFSGFQIRPLAPGARLVTPRTGRRDARGKLLPQQTYSETMKRYTDWMARSVEVIDRSKAPKPLQSLEPYLLTNFVSADDLLWGLGGEMAFNHALLITGAVHYYLYTGDRKYLDMAVRTADWEIEYSTPAGWALPYLAPSFVSFKPDGSWEGQDWGYEPDKSAYMGFAYLRLYAVTGNQKYLETARRIAGTLLKIQGPDGSWPFRINARTGETKHSYGCSQLWYVWFFEKLAEVTGDESFRKPAQQAFDWLLKNPVQTNQWVGLYGDIVSGARSFDQWVALEMAMVLIDRRGENPGYLPAARRILDWIERMLVVDYGFFPGVPGVVEQSQYRVVLTHHELRYAEIYAKLWEATRDPKYKDLALEIANSVTWNLMSDGKMRQGFWDHSKAAPLALCFNEQFSRIMAAIPESAPRNEHHWQRSTSLVRDIRYEPKRITYRTVGASQDQLTVAAAPQAVRAGGQDLAVLADPQKKAAGWHYDPATGLLQIRHEAAEVEIVFP